MNVILWRRLERGIRGLTPFVTTLALVLLGTLPLPLPGFTTVMPWLTLMAVYYWSIYRPDLLPLVATFLLGLVQDSLSGTPLGLNVSVLLVVQGVVVSQRRFFHGKSFMVVWSGFAVLASGAVALNWVLAMAFYAALASPTPALFQLVLTVALFPCLTWFFRLVRRDLLRPI